MFYNPGYKNEKPERRGRFSFPKTTWGRNLGRKRTQREPFLFWVTINSVIMNHSFTIVSYYNLLEVLKGFNMSTGVIYDYRTSLQYSSDGDYWKTGECCTWTVSARPFLGGIHVEPSTFLMSPCGAIQQLSAQVIHQDLPGRSRGQRVFWMWALLSQTAEHCNNLTRGLKRQHIFFLSS